MRRAAVFALVACLTGFLVACDAGSGQSQKIGVVDLNRLMRESDPGKAGLKFIEEQQAQLQARLDAIQDRLEKSPADEKAVQELQQLYAASQQKIQAEGQNVVTMLFDNIQKTLNAYREKNGYALLVRIEALDSYDPQLDVTNAVMADVNKLKLEFKPLAGTAEGANATVESKEPENSQAEPAPGEKPEKPEQSLASPPKK